jgi:hypothetical protein
MATTIVTKNGSGAPTDSDLVAGELAVDLTNGRLYTTDLDSGGTVLELGTNPASDVTFGDNTKAIFGAGSDLQIYHNASDSIINDNGTGSLKLQQGGSTKLEVTATGVDITGTLVSDGLTVESSSDPTSITLRHTGNTSGLVIKNFSGAESQLVNVDNGPMVFKTNDTEAMRIDSSGNVGIGSSSALTSTYLSKAFVYTAGGANFAIGGSSNTNNAVLGRFTSYNIANSNSANEGSANFYGVTSIESIAVTTDSNAGDDSGGSLLFKTKPEAGALQEAMRIDSSGDVSIGDASTEGAKLHIRTSNATTYNPASTSGADGVNLIVHNDNATANTTAGIILRTQVSGSFADARINNIGVSQNNSAMTFHTEGSGTVAERMRIDSSGNLLVGDTSTVPFDGTSGVLIGGGRTSLAFATTGHTHKMLYSVNSGTPGLHFYDSTNNRTDMIWDNSGNLLVGTTDTSAKLHVGSDLTSLQAFRAFGTTTGDTTLTCGQFAKYDNNTTTSQVFVNFTVNNGGIAQGQINANGAGAVAFGSWSDSRLKENITDLPNQLANITALRPVEFDYIESEGGGHQLGFIAQEVEEIYPDLVGERPDGMKTLSGMGKMEARLIKAIQEQQAIIDSLTARIAALES